MYIVTTVSDCRGCMNCIGCSECMCNNLVVSIRFMVSLYEMFEVYMYEVQQVY